MVKMLIFVTDKFKGNHLTAIDLLKKAEYMLYAFPNQESLQYKKIVGITQNNLACYYKR
jgi:hypothetical protein